MTLTCAVINNDRSIGVAAQTLPSVNTLRIIGSGNSGLDPIFEGGGDKTASSNKLQWFLNQVSGQTAALAYNSTIVGSMMDYRYAVDSSTAGTTAGYARWNSSDGNLLILCGQSGDAGANITVFCQNVLNWCKLYWTSGNGGAGADVVLWCAQLRRGISDGAGGITPTDWKNFAQSMMTRYEAAIQFVNARLPAGRKPVRFMPMPVIMERIRLDTAAGLAPTSTFFDDLYNEPLATDPFHLGNKPLAKWLTGGAATILLTGCSPAQLPATAQDLATLDAASLLYLRRVMHDTLKAYRFTGLNTSAWVRA